MSKLGKGLLFFALVGAIAAGVMGYLVTGKWNETKQELTTANGRVTQLTGQLKTTQNDLKTTQDDLKATQDKYTQDESKIADLNNSLTQAQKEAADAKSALDSAKADAATATQKLNDITTALGGKSPDDFKKDLADAQKERDDAVAQQKVLQDSVDQANQKIKDLIADINAKNQGKEPPGVSGKVTFVDRTWNFVVLDVGLDAGVVPNGELIVYRGKTFLGKIRITRADPNDAVAEILPDVKAQIQVGDAVLN